MPLSFPSSPSVNDTYTVSGRTYIWDGTAWRTVKYPIPTSVPSLDVTGDLTSDTDTLYIDSTTDRVGIGTSSPTTTLDVDGTITATSVSAPLTGNVTGNLTGDVTGDVAASAVTIGGNNVTPYTGRRNALINGDMRVAQRYTSNTHGSGGGTSYWYCDRWRVHDYNWSAGSDVTVSRSTDAPDGFQYSAKWANGATALTFGTGGSQFMQQRVEGYNAMHLYDSEYVTVSFWVKSSTAGTYTLQIQNGSTRVIHKEYSISSANTWEHKTITIPMSTGTASGTWDVTNGVGINLAWYFGAASDRIGDDYIDTWGTRGNYHFLTTNSVNLATIANSSFYMTGVQLEPGDKATPFEHRSFGEELALCQRYYEKSYIQSHAPGTATYTGAVTTRPWSTTSTYTYVSHTFAVTKRATPTITIYSVADGSAGYWFESGFGNRSGGADNHGESGFNLRNTTVLAGTGHIFCHWVAESEL